MANHLISTSMPLLPGMCTAVLFRPPHKFISNWEHFRSGASCLPDVVDLLRLFISSFLLAVVPFWWLSRLHSSIVSLCVLLSVLIWLFVCCRAQRVFFSFFFLNWPDALCPSLLLPDFLSGSICSTHFDAAAVHLHQILTRHVFSEEQSRAESWFWNSAETCHGTAGESTSIV